MPLKPVHRASGIVKKFEEFAPEERRSWVIGMSSDYRGSFGVAAPLRHLDTAAIEHALALGQKVPAKLRDADFETAVGDLQALLDDAKARA